MAELTKEQIHLGEAMITARRWARFLQLVDKQNKRFLTFSERQETAELRKHISNFLQWMMAGGECNVEEINKVVNEVEAQKEAAE